MRLCLSGSPACAREDPNLFLNLVLFGVTSTTDQPYIVHHDLPKVENLRKVFPDLYVTRSPK